MAKDVYSRDHIAYHDPLNRLGTAYRLAHSGHLVVSRTPLVDALAEGLPFAAPSEYFFMRDYIVDYARIVMGFENYAKALVLLEGFVVHEFEGSGPAVVLRNAQRRGPVSIPEMLRVLSFQYDPSRGVDGENYIPGLSEKTLGFRSIIEHYEHLHRLPVPIVEALLHAAEVRNTLHFLDGALVATSLDRLSPLAIFSHADMRERVTALAEELARRQEIRRKLLE